MVVTEAHLKSKVNRAFSRLNPENRYVSSEYWECLYFIVAVKLSKGKPELLLTGTYEEKERLHKTIVFLIEQFFTFWAEDTKTQILARTLKRVTGLRHSDFSSKQSPVYEMLLMLSRNVFDDFTILEKKIIHRHSYHNLKLGVFPFWRDEVSKNCDLSFAVFFKRFLREAMNLCNRSMHLSRLAKGSFKPLEVFSGNTWSKITYKPN